MRKKLDKELSGIRRPVALMLTDDEEIRNKLGDYTISQLEPLHDLKTMICKFNLSFIETVQPHGVHFNLSDLKKGL